MNNKIKISNRDDMMIRIETFIDEQLDKYDWTPKLLDKIDDFANTTSNAFDFQFNFMALDIKDGKMKINDVYYKNNDHTQNNRKQIMIKLINESIAYGKKNGIEIKDCTIHLLTSDSYNYSEQDMPIFLLARPENKKGILIPDNTYKCNTVNCKSLNLDETKNIVNKYCKNKNKKKNSMYFRGANTGAKKHNLRMLLHKVTANSNKFDIKIGKQHRVPLYDFCKYKYLLNLPGHHPWSYRFKYLFMMNSLVINVDMHQYYGKYNNSYNTGWRNFFDVLFDEGIDYVNIVYKWKENDTKNNYINFKKLVKKLKTVHKYYSKNNDKYETMVKNGYDKMALLTQDVVYESVLMLINKYADRINSIESN